MARPPNPLADPVALVRKAGRWAIRYYPTGLVGDPATRKLWRKSFATREEAEPVADALRKDLYALRAKTGAGLPKPAHLLSMAIEAFIEALEAAPEPRGTRNKHRSNARVYLLAPEFSSLSVSDLPSAAMQIVRSVEGARLERPRNGKRQGDLKDDVTISSARNTLRHFGAWLVSEGYLEHSPFDVIAEQAQASRLVKRQTKRERAEERALRAVPEVDDGDADRGLGLEDVPDLADVSALRDAVIRRETVGNPARRHKGRGSKGGLRPLTEQQVRPSADSVTLRAAAGLRTCECLGVHTSRVKLDQGLIVVDRQLDRYRPWIPGEPPPLVPPKHNHAREARVWSMFMPTLEEWCRLADQETNGWLVVPTRGQKWPVDAHEKMVERAVALLAWEYQEATTQGDSPLPPLWKWKSHYLRHVYGSWSLASRDHGGLGWSITLVQESMGHVSERTTREIYRHVILPEREAARTASILWPGL